MATVQTQAVERTSLATTLPEFARREDEPSWVTERRKVAWEAYRDGESPDRVTHLWRYSDPAAFELPEGELASLSPKSRSPVQEIRSHLGNEHHAAEAISHNGNLVHLQMVPQLQAQGVLLCDLHTAVREHGSLVEPHLGRLVGHTHGKFEALSEALWQGGLFLYVPRNTEVEKPIHLVVTAGQGTRFLSPRLLAVVDEGARVTLVDEYTSSRESDFYANSTAELMVLAGAHLRYVVLQRWGEQITSYFTQRTHLDRDAEVLAVWAGLGGRKVKTDLGSVIQGRGANVKLLGMSFAQDSQQFDQHTVHDHQAGNSQSNLDFKVVLKDKARSAYTGLIRIARHAPACEAYQENRNLLLSDNTRADTIPELEILTDEVRCTHGATIGPVDEEALFYLAARGIPRDEAVRMVVGGFVEPTLKAVPEDLQPRLRSYVMERVKEI